MKELEFAKKNLKMLKKDGQRIISKMITVDETNVRFFEKKTPNELKQWVFKGEEKQPQIKMGRSEKRFFLLFSLGAMVWLKLLS